MAPIDVYLVIQFSGTLLEPFVGAYIKSTGGSTSLLDKTVLDRRMTLDQMLLQAKDWIQCSCVLNSVNKRDLATAWRG
jgi:hypothetical protein